MHNNRQKLCKARINTKSDDIIKKVGEQNHAANAANVGVRKTLTEMKKRVLSKILLHDILLLNLLLPLLIQKESICRLCRPCSAQFTDKDKEMLLFRTH